MNIESRETEGNGKAKNFVECPCCGQKMLNVVSLAGEAEIVVKCRRCRRYVKIRMVP